MRIAFAHWQYQSPRTCAGPGMPETPARNATPGKCANLGATAAHEGHWNPGMMRAAALAKMIETSTEAAAPVIFGNLAHDSLFQLLKSDGLHPCLYHLIVPQNSRQHWHPDSALPQRQYQRQR